MNDCKYYLITLNDLNTVILREKNEFDEMLLEFINLYKNDNVSDNVIATYIAIAIDYPVKAIENLILEYRINGLLDNIENKNLINKKENFKLQYTKYLIYNKDDNTLTSFDKERIKDLGIDKNRKIDDATKGELATQLYHYLKVSNDGLNDEYLVDLSFTEGKINKIVENKDYNTLNYYLENVKIEAITKIPRIKNPMTQYLDECKKWLKSNNYRQAFIDNDIDDIYNKIFKENKNTKFPDFYYSIDLCPTSKINNRVEINNKIAKLISLTKESIFIVSTKLPDMNQYEKPAMAFKNLNKKIHKRFIYGLGENENKSITINFDNENNRFGEEFSGHIHSKVIIIDERIVIMGSGNWFSSKPSNFNDSCIILYSEDALNKYNPIYNKNTDYYKLIIHQIDQINKLKVAFDFYRLINMDTIYDSKYVKERDILQENILNKIFSLIPSQFDENKELIIDILNSDDILYQVWFKKLLLNKIKLSLNETDYINFLKNLK